MNRERESLLRRVAELEDGQRTAPVRLALAEAEFRLAVLPGAGPAEAIERLRQALRHDPYSAKAHLHLGRLLHRGGRRWSALAAYREAHRLAPHSRRAPLLMATALLDLDRPERAVGADLLASLARGDPAQVEAAVAGLDDLIEAGRSRAGEPGGRGQPRRSVRPPGKDVLAGADPPAWHALLQEQLARKQPTSRWVHDYLHGGVDPAEAAATAAVLVACGAAPEAVRSAPGVARPPDHPAARLLAATLRLAEAGDPEEFVELATGLLSARMLPAELVCALHFTRWASGEEDVLAALRLLDAYPVEVRDLESFRRLRLAVLGAHAERAWAAEQFDEAGVLWQAMVRLDPDHPDVAVNLAMLATRNRSSGYRPAWDRVAELFYAAAAEAGDLGHRADDRIALHRAHSRQSLRAAGGDRPDEEELRRWIADGDAVEVWLRQWDLYYLNARLGFRSAAHLLAAPADAGEEETAQARDVLRRHLGLAVGERDWSGAEAFERLADARIEQAYRSGPGTDTHREAEQAAADELLDEALRRALLLRRLADALSPAGAARHRELACAVLRHLFVLPLSTLDLLCAERGLIASDERLITLLDNAAASVAWSWTGTVADGPGDTARMLADVEAATAAAPSSVGLAVPHGRLLLWAGRGTEAYARVAAALPGATSGWMRDLLAAVVDDVAEAQLESRLDGADDRAALTAARALSAEFPLSTGPRIAVAARLVRLGGDGRLAEAVRLLADGARTARADQQRRRLHARLRSLPKAADAVVGQLVQEHWRRYRAGEGIGHLEHALGLAQARRLDRPAARLRDELNRARAEGEPPDVHD